MSKDTVGIGHKTEFRLAKFKVPEDELRSKIESDGFDAAVDELAYEVDEWEGNVGLNEGLQEMWTLTIGAGGTAYNNSNANIGVGNSSSSASETQTGLLGTDAYEGMESGYPQRTDQTMAFKSVFGANVANFEWKEFTVANGSSNAATNLFRKVHDRGEKYEGESWTMEIQITLE